MHRFLARPIAVLRHSVRKGPQLHSVLIDPLGSREIDSALDLGLLTKDHYVRGGTFMDKHGLVGVVWCLLFCHSQITFKRKPQFVLWQLDQPVLRKILQPSAQIQDSQIFNIELVFIKLALYFYSPREEFHVIYVSNGDIVRRENIAFVRANFLSTRSCYR